MHINDTPKTFRGVAGELFLDDVEEPEEGGLYIYNPENPQAWIEAEFKVEDDFLVDLAEMR